MTTVDRWVRQCVQATSILHIVHVTLKFDFGEILVACKWHEDAPQTREIMQALALWTLEHDANITFPEEVITDVFWTLHLFSSTEY